MALLTPDLIQATFASGGEKDTPPQLSPQGFVNFTEGYTPFYEMRLDAGQPQAKAVERKVQNYMFNQATLHAKAWQSACIPPWYAGMPGGYAKNAIVIHEIAGVATPFRSLVAGNVTTPGSAPTQWEYVQTVSEMIQNIPMPSGGATTAMASAGIIATGGAAYDPLTLPRGTYMYSNNAAAAATPNLPKDIHTAAPSALAGILEVCTASAVAGVKILRYVDMLGNVYILPSGSTTWVQYTNYGILQAQKPTFALTASTTTNNYLANLTPAPAALTDGMEVRLRMHASNTGASTLNLNNLGAKTILGQAFQALSGSEMLIGRNVTLRWTPTSDAWVIINATSRLQVNDAIADNHVPSWKQVKDYVATEVVIDWDEVQNKPDVVINKNAATLSTLLLNRNPGGANPAISWRNTDGGLTRFSESLIDDNTIRLATQAVVLREYTQTTVDYKAITFFQQGIRCTQTTNGMIRFLASDGQTARYLFTSNDTAMYFYGYDDAAAAQLIYTANRHTQVMAFSKRPTFEGVVPWDENNLAMTGAISAFSHSSPGGGWLFCDGSAVSRTTYAALFAKIGTTFGAGNGSTTFNVPDLRGQFVRGVDAGRGLDPSRVLGSSQSFAMQSHSHTATASNAGTHDHTATALAAGSHTHTTTVSTDGIHTHTASTGDAGAHTHTVSGTSGTTNTSRFSSAIQQGGSAASITVPASGQSTTGVMCDGQSVSGPFGIYFTNTLEGHAHSISATAASNGTHDHTVSIANSTGHTHTVTNSTIGNHQHTVDVDVGGDHAHTIVVNANGSTETRPTNVALHYFIHI
jgi:hypothetical protein